MIARHETVSDTGVVVVSERKGKGKGKRRGVGGFHCGCYRVQLLDCTISLFKSIIGMESLGLNFVSLVKPIPVSVVVPTSDLSMPTSLASSLEAEAGRLICLLQRIQSAAFQTSRASPDAFDPKPFVDLPLRCGLRETEEAFSALSRDSAGSIPVESLLEFLEHYFDEAGSDIQVILPDDFEAEPEGFLENVHNLDVRNWALEVHSKWLELTRLTVPDVREHPERHTLLPLPHPVVVPGSRFREVYYWDSYWTIRGLLVSKMVDTAKGVVLNLLSLAESLGFVPNGARSYYSNRSQPCLLSEMVKSVYLATSDSLLLEQSLPVLLREYARWTSAPHKVRISKGGRTFELSRYFAFWNEPRPESYTIDVEVASNVPEELRPQLYLDIASAAESGWDFSSRWMEDPEKLHTLRTTRILPVDLNAFLYQMEGNISEFASILGEGYISDQFSAFQAARKVAMDAVFWNDAKGQWLDYWLPKDSLEPYVFSSSAQNRQNLVSNYIPLWTGLVRNENSGRASRVVSALRMSGLLQEAGVATTDLNTGQQWDAPNGWAPLQHMVIEGLGLLDDDSATDLAVDIARRWLTTNYITYKQTGHMHEKYDVTSFGSYGGGGEYEPQTGFGWTNGVALSLLDTIGWPADLEIES
ncbi:hypothetical protein R1sor_020901 [Riccia sorocarpa]|uniref:Trehalase n=1 Tax=Riccia sorocarpa TaxID=122646 RepID=A0ABD3GIN2_9MARC